MKNISIRGAKTHNLQNVDVTFPRDKLIVITGLSGSGKSSLAFDTLYAEGQRRYVESLSAYARQFLSMMEKPDVDHIEGLSPAISIEQKSTSHNPRSTVGTITEIYDYLRLLYARVGEPRCPKHDTVLEAQTITQMVDWVMTLPEETKIMILAPVVRSRKGEHKNLLQDLARQGFIRARIDGEVVEIDEAPELDLRRKHDIEVVIDRVKVREDVALRLAESFETAARMADGVVTVSYMDETDKPDQVFSTRYACTECGYAIAELEPRLFSFNNPVGACPDCDGLGTCQFFDVGKVVTHPELTLEEGAIRGWDKRNVYYFHIIKSLAQHFDFPLDKPFNKLSKRVQDIILNGSGKEKIEFVYITSRGRRWKRKHAFDGVLGNMSRRYKETESETVREELAKYLSNQPCRTCSGARLREEARHVFVGGLSLSEMTAKPINDLVSFVKKVKLKGYRADIAVKILKEIIDRLTFLEDVGLEYLTLDRSAETLSGGEAQRIRLASQIGSGLVGVMYILDEPSIGLHQRDNARLLSTLTRLRDLGNTVIVVEHDEDAIRLADHVVDMGPGAGVHGGHVVAEGDVNDIIAEKESVTGQFLSGVRKITVPAERTVNDPGRQLIMRNVTTNNLQSVTVKFPVGCFICVTGVSGSGKSSLVNDTLYPIAANTLNRAQQTEPKTIEEIDGLDHFDKVLDIDQSPIGRTPRSNPATYTGIFTPIRDLFSGTQEARSRGYKPGRFSFNVKGGRCEACQGDGLIKVEMHFLPDIYVVCDACEGKRYNRETLEVLYKGKNIHQVLDMTVEDALEFFQNVPSIAKKCQTLCDIGLSYVRLGQSATTLSGGEAQRVKLAKELAKRDTGNTLYILDEPTTGLHFHDIEQLLKVLHRLRDHGNTVIVIEHNLDVIKTADWIIDIGPDGGVKGGQVVAEGTPEEIAQCQQSYTGEFLKPLLPALEKRKKAPAKKMASKKVIKKAKTKMATKKSKALV